MEGSNLTSGIQYCIEVIDVWGGWGKANGATQDLIRQRLATMLATQDSEGPLSALLGTVCRLCRRAALDLPADTPTPPHESREETVNPETGELQNG